MMNTNKKIIIENNGSTSPDNIQVNNGGDFDKNPPVNVNLYDSSIRNFCAAYEEIFDMAHACLSGNLTDDSNILIVGCGTGSEICRFSESNPNWRLTGVDPSAEMLSIAKSKMDNLQLSNATLYHGYVSELDPQKNFDAATCILVMHFLKDDGSKLSLLKDIHGRMKKDGVFILVDAVGVLNSPQFQLTLSSWKQYVIQKGVEADFVEEGFRTQILPRLKFVSEERMLELFKDAGFQSPAKFYQGFLYGGWVMKA